jgi:hypothetical protein
MHAGATGRAERVVVNIVATPEARSRIRESGGLLFVRLSPPRSVRGAMRSVLLTTDPPPDALDYQRFETKGFLLFLEPGLRPPRELHVHVVGWLRRRVRAFWNGCAFVL